MADYRRSETREEVQVRVFFLQPNVVKYLKPDFISGRLATSGWMADLRRSKTREAVQWRIIMTLSGDVGYSE